MAAAIQIGCRSRAIVLTAVTTPPLPLREENLSPPSECKRDRTAIRGDDQGPAFEQAIER